MPKGGAAEGARERPNTKLFLGSAESFTLTATRLPGGKFSVRSGTSQAETVILADQVLELRMRADLIHALRKRKATDAYSHLEDLAKQTPIDDI